MKYFQPDFEFEHFTNITVDFLKKQNITSIFSDLDSTLSAHDQLGDETFAQWYKRLKANDIKLIIISNNSQGRVDRFTHPYNILGYGKCSKPKGGKIKKIMAKLGVSSEHSLFLGDQLFTDVLCGKRLKMKTALVNPVGEQFEPFNIRLKRIIERWIKKQWVK